VKLATVRRRAARSVWTPVGVFAALGASLFLFRKVYGGIPLVTRIYHRDRANGVVPPLQDFLSHWERVGPFPIMVGVDGGVRTLVDQKRLYAKGRTTKGEPPYTATKPLGQTVTDADTNQNSAHGHAGALDIWPVDALGRPQFDLNDPVVKAKYERIGSFAKNLGLEWGGDWPLIGKRADYPHIQVSNWAALPVALGPLTA
jgi:hypothetical protein